MGNIYKGEIRSGIAKFEQITQTCWGTPKQAVISETTRRNGQYLKPILIKESNYIELLQNAEMI